MISTRNGKTAPNCVGFQRSLLSGKEKSNNLMLSKDGSSQPQFPWSRAMRAIWLINTIEVDLSHLGIPLMRVPSALRDLDDIFADGTMSDQDRQLIEDELSRAHASLAQVVGELQAGMTEIEALLQKQHSALTSEDVEESTRSVVWQKL
jgi:hypothetical protein